MVTKEKARYWVFAMFMAEDLGDKYKVDTAGPRECKTKDQVLGAVKVILKNTSPMRILIMDTSYFKDETRQATLNDLPPECKVSGEPE